MAIGATQVGVDAKSYLGVPIMVAIKAVCERVEDLQPIAAFLGQGEAKTASGDSQAPPVES